MNYLAVGQEPPGIELLLLFSFGFDWFVSNVRYLDWIRVLHISIAWWEIVAVTESIKIAWIHEMEWRIRVHEGIGDNKHEMLVIGVLILQNWL